MRKNKLFIIVFLLSLLFVSKVQETYSVEHLGTIPLSSHFDFYTVQDG